VKEALLRVAVPDAGTAEERARDVVLAAFVAREPVARPHRARRIGVAATLAAVAVALAAASPPGMAVVDRVREAVGVERSAPALFSLPGGGRLLVASDGGVWIVEHDGGKRFLAGYPEASWSPFGRFVVATRANELAALEPDGDVRWTLARPGVHGAFWGGTRSDTRIAFVDRTGLRVVAGDGTGDRVLAPEGQGPIAWRSGSPHVLAYLAGGGVRIQDADTGRVLALLDGRFRPRLHTDLEWSTDGRRLLIVNDGVLRVFGGNGKLILRSSRQYGRVVDAVFRPGSHTVLVARTRRGQSMVTELGSGRTVFSGIGVFDEITPSSGGRWLLVEWRTADQWVFVRLEGSRTIRAVAGIARQFRGKPVVEGWCCGQ
jgi:hypothetical protein